MYVYARDIMHDVTVLSPDSTIKQAADTMDEKNIGSVLVKDEGGNLGIVTERDIIKKVVSAGLTPESTRLSQIMTTPVETIDADADIHRLASAFSEKAIRRLPVTEDGELVGIITTRDVSKTLIPAFFKEHPNFQEIKEFKKTG